MENDGIKRGELLTALAQQIESLQALQRMLASGEDDVAGVRLAGAIDALGWAARLVANWKVHVPVGAGGDDG